MGLGGVLHSAAVVLMLGCAIAVLAITGMQLSDINTVNEVLNFNGTASCLLSKDGSNSNICNFAYAASGASVIAVLAVTLTKFITCNCLDCGLGFDGVFAILGTALWVVAALLFSVEGGKADDAGLPKKGYRGAVIFLSYACVCLFGFLLFNAIVRAGCRFFARRKRHADEETAGLYNQKVAMSSAPHRAPVQSDRVMESKSRLRQFIAQ